MLNASQRSVNKSSLTWWYVLKTSWRHLCKMSWRHLCKMSWRRFQNVLKTSWKRFEAVLARRLQDVWPRRIYWSWPRRRRRLWRRVTKANIFVLIKTSWKHLLKTKTREETSLQDVFKTFSRRLHQDECLLGILINQVLSWNYQKNIWT